MFIFICGISAKVTCAFLVSKKQTRKSQKKLSIQKNDSFCIRKMKCLFDDILISNTLICGGSLRW